MRHGEMTEAGGGRPPPAPHPDPGPRRVLRGGDGHVGARAAHRRPGPPVLRRPDQRGGDRRDGRRSCARSTTPNRRHERLVEAANAHGGADNITVVIVDVQVGEEGQTGRSPRSRPLGLGRRRPTWAPLRATAAVPAVGTGCRPTGAHRGRPDLTGSVAGSPGRVPRPPPSAMDDTLAPGARSASATSRRRWPERARTVTSSSWARRPRCPWPAPRPGCPRTGATAGNRRRRRAAARGAGASGSRGASRPG